MDRSSSLYKRITSQENIFNAIYALESYVFEQGLLSKSDHQLYIDLSDKYNTSLIDATIHKCQILLDNILIGGQLFRAKVFFKLKKEENGLPVFRPIHSADLISQICMVCMLQIIMFEDTKDGRRLSPLSMMIPHNFYGNVPSTNLHSIFLPWKEQYKKYQDDVLSSCREYKLNNKYLHEVTLDLKDFFPSVHPGILVSYILNFIYIQNQDEIDDYKMVIQRLLTCKLEEDDIYPWRHIYYGPQINGKNAYITKGIPQGLPQSYYFGNLVMVKISEEVAKIIDGDAYYYVDDSVIYTNCSEKSFSKCIIEINNCLTRFESEVDNTEFIGNRSQVRLQKRLKYGVQFHQKGKSAIYDIGKRMDPHFLFEIGDQISKTSQLFLNIDEIDENSSLEKLDALVSLVEQCYENLTDPDGKDLNDAKLLLRFKKFFRFRQSLLQLREKGKVNAEFIASFKSKFLLDSIPLSTFFKNYDSDIFQTEARLIALNTNNGIFDSFLEDITKLEMRMMNIAKIESGESSLYYSKDIKSCEYFNGFESDSYKTLRSILPRHFKFRSTQKINEKFEDLSQFWEKWKKCEDTGLSFSSADKYVKKHSFDYSRMVMNAYSSWVLNVDIDDRSILFKNNHRLMLMKEYRLLAFLRNHYSSEEAFDSFFHDLLNDQDPLCSVEVSPSLSEVMGIFFTDVRNPQYTDHLIRTHNVVSCLWKNGSKFMHAYTLHNEEHSVELIRQASRLAKKIDYFSLKSLDYYILFLACYLHDISLVIHPDIDSFSFDSIITNQKVTKFLEEYKSIKKSDKQYYPKMKHVMLHCFKEVFDYFEGQIRANHPIDSARFIRERAGHHFKYLEASVLELVAKVSESHGYDVFNIYGIKSQAKKELYSLKYMMILVRLADLMDVTSARVNYILLKENFKHMSEVSRFHWISHYITKDASLQTKYRLKEGTQLFDRPIIEDIVVEIDMSIDCRIIKTKENNCHGWERQVIDDNDSHEKRILCFTPSNFHGGVNSSNCKRCDSMCYWIWLKNQYLFKELEALQTYLNNVNSSIIDTRIRIEAHLTNKSVLDKELYDHALSFVMKS